MAHMDYVDELRPCQSRQFVERLKLVPARRPAQLRAGRPLTKDSGAVHRARTPPWA